MMLRSLMSGAPSTKRACVRWFLALALLASTAVGMRMHANSMTELREQGLPLAAELPQLERRLNLLTAEVQLSEVQKELRNGSQEERLNVFVFPDTLQRERVIGYLDAIGHSLETRKLARGATKVTIGTPEAGEYDLQRATVQATFTVSIQGVSSLVTMLRLSGLLTVADALPSEALQDLLRPLEATHPADIVALEQFLATDLRAYAEQPRVYEDRLLNSVGATGFRDVFSTVYKSSLLPEAQQFFEGETGKHLAQKGLWPSPFLLIKNLSVGSHDAQGFAEVIINMETFTREER